MLVDLTFTNQEYLTKYLPKIWWHVLRNTRVTGISFQSLNVCLSDCAVLDLLSLSGLKLCKCTFVLKWPAEVNKQWDDLSRNSKRWHPRYSAAVLSQMCMSYGFVYNAILDLLDMKRKSISVKDIRLHVKLDGCVRCHKHTVIIPLPSLLLCGISRSHCTQITLTFRLVCICAEWQTS